ncbi:hypothetical protein COCNU_scaffold004352G000020 [Cocos nucifera]|nr:hypothetical protein [Cocos nucifera]
MRGWSQPNQYLMYAGVEPTQPSKPFNPLTAILLDHALLFFHSHALLFFLLLFFHSYTLPLFFLDSALKASTQSNQAHLQIILVIKI